MKLSGKFVFLFLFFILSINIISSIPLIANPNSFNLTIDIFRPVENLIKFNISNPNNFSFVNITLLNKSDIRIFSVNNLETSIFNLSINETKEIALIVNSINNFTGNISLGGFYINESFNNSTNQTEQLLLRDDTFNAFIHLDIKVLLSDTLELRQLMTLYGDAVISYCSSFPSDIICSRLLQRVSDAFGNNSAALITEEFLRDLKNFMQEQREFRQFLKDNTINNSQQITNLSSGVELIRNENNETNKNIVDLKHDSLNQTVVLLGTFLALLLIFLIFYYKKKKLVEQSSYLRGDYMK